MARSSLLLLWTICLWPNTGWSQLPQTGPRFEHRLRYRSLTAAQVNPLGLQSDLFLGYRRRLYQREGEAFDNYAGAMVITRLNPAFVRLGAGVELQPLAVLTLRALYEHRLYFGSVNMLQSFATPEDEHGEDEIRKRGDADKNYSTHGAQITLQAILRARVGPIAILNDFNAVYFRMKLHQPDSVFYVNLFDTLCPNDGFVLINHAHLILLLTRIRMLVGVRHSLVHAIYDEKWNNLNTPHHRLGPIVAYTFGDVSSRFRQPTLVLIVNWWIGSRYRSPSAVPYGVIAFQFTGDLWTK